jgi:hypothetical protein
MNNTMDKKRQLEILEELKADGLFLSDQKFNPSYTKKFRNSITKEKQAWYDSIPGEVLSQKVFHLINDLPNLPVCKICGNPVKFVSPKEGYREYCSATCRANGEADNVAKTNMAKYGTKAPAQSKSVMDKMKATTMERFGVENAFQRKDLVVKGVQEKYGVDNVMHVDDIKTKVSQAITTLSRDKRLFLVEKRKETNLERYGNPVSVHSPKIWEKAIAKKRETFYSKLITDPRFTSKATPAFSIEEYQGVVDKDKQVIYYPWICVTCKETFKDYFASNRGPRCPKCFPTEVKGRLEKEMVEWLRSEFPELNIIQGSRKIISPLEIDIYLPDYNFAIEFDEVYWHREHNPLNTSSRGQHYHSQKTENCQKQGIHLIHVFDSEWVNSTEIVKSIIRSNIGVYERKLGARQGEVREVEDSEAQSFLNANHIQGYAPSGIRYGLYIKDELVSLLCIGPNRFKKGTYEIVRFVNKVNTQVSGALTKIFKVAKENIPVGSTLISYVDKRYFKGESNTKLGLVYQYTNHPSFYYTKDNKTLYNRMSFQKGLLASKLKDFDPTLTEGENMLNNGYDRIWDCGTMVYSGVIDR